MSGEKRARLKQWLESGEARLQPLTFPQRELWEASAVPAGDVSNHICSLLFIKGPITEALSRTAVQMVVDRQEAFRTSILPGKEAPLQLVRKSCEASYQFQELTDDQTTPEAIEELALAAFRQPFDLVQGPLYRVLHLQVAAGDHVLVFAAHHAVADGWTLGVFVQDLSAAYVLSVRKLAGSLPPVPMSYTTWGATERAVWQPVELAPRAEYWKAHLAGSSLLWSRPDTGGGLAAVLQRVICRIPADLTASVRELARRNGVTLFSTLQAAFRLTLHQWTGRDDIVIGSPVANRSTQAVRETMGYFAGNVPLRCRVDASRPFAATMRIVHEETVNSFSHAMPFAELVRCLDRAPTPGQHQVYDVRFALQNHPMPDSPIPGISVKLQMRSTGTARFDLGCEVTEEGDTLEVVWLTRPNLFPEDTVQHLQSVFETILAAGSRSPEISLAVLLNEM